MISGLPLNMENLYEKANTSSNIGSFSMLIINEISVNGGIVDEKNSPFFGCCMFWLSKEAILSFKDGISG